MIICYEFMIWFYISSLIFSILLIDLDLIDLLPGCLFYTILN
jgi:hypothetical protein